MTRAVREIYQYKCAVTRKLTVAPNQNHMRVSSNSSKSKRYVVKIQVACLGFFWLQGQIMYILYICMYVDSEPVFLKLWVFILIRGGYKLTQSRSVAQQSPPNQNNFFEILFRTRMLDSGMWRRLRLNRVKSV